VLKEFAAILKEYTRARYQRANGGDEFLLVLSHVGQSDIKTAVERLRERLPRKVFF